MATETNEILTPATNGYGADSIQVLEGLEAVRKRTAMYIADVAEKDLHQLVYEVVDNAIVSQDPKVFCREDTREDKVIFFLTRVRRIRGSQLKPRKTRAFEPVMTVGNVQRRNIGECVHDLSCS